MKVPIFIRARIQNYKRYKSYNRYIKWRASKLGITTKEYKELIRSAKTRV